MWAAPHAQGRSYGRSMVISQNGIVATSQVVASQAGAQILAGGGSAVDAAIAFQAVLAGAEAVMTGPGGDLFGVFPDAQTRKITGLKGARPGPQTFCSQVLPQDGGEKEAT